MAINAHPVALITGGGKRRVGNVIAETLAGRGYNIALHYHTSKAAAEASCRRFATQGVEAWPVQADFSKADEVERTVAQSLKKFGRIDVLVNSAAIWQAKRLEAVAADDVRRHFEINTLATFICAQKVGLTMVAQSAGGVIVNIADWAIHRPYLNFAAYFPSKGAIPALTRSLAVELGTRNPAVRVNCILPGPVMLPDDMPAAERELVIRQTLVKRAGRPEDVAHAVLFLIENTFVTGACIPIDGGRSIYANDE